MSNIEIFNSAQFARKVGVSPQTLRRWHKVGKFVGLKMETGYLIFTDRHYEAFLDQRNIRDIGELLNKSEVENILNSPQFSFTRCKNVVTR